MRPRGTGGGERTRHLFAVGSGLERPPFRSPDEWDVAAHASAGDDDAEEYAVEWALPRRPPPMAEPVDDPAGGSAARNASRSCHPAGTNRQSATQAGKIA
ncbi:MAG: hypothetical protein QOG97_2626 [Acidimicrobiaceae bacterium]|jgi:hypothetical protein|nr:hypothetical protein [Acidimicrobiaceae bacterium]